MRRIIDGRPQNRTVDGVCAKLKYTSAAKARKAVKYYRRAGKAVYQCRWCGAWHTTSQRPAR